MQQAHKYYSEHIVEHDGYQVIRKELAGEKPKDAFPLVIYDPPHKTSNEEKLPTIEKE